MAQEQKKTSKNTNSRRRGSARGRNANGSNSRTPSRKINATRQATAPQQDAVLIAPPKYRKGSMRITPLGGLGEIGRNMNVIEYNGHLLLIDCGVLFPRRSSRAWISSCPISATSRTISTRSTPWCSPTATRTTSAACLPAQAAPGHPADRLQADPRLRGRQVQGTPPEPHQG